MLRWRLFGSGHVLTGEVTGAYAEALPAQGSPESQCTQALLQLSADTERVSSVDQHAPSQSHALPPLLLRRCSLDAAAQPANSRRNPDAIMPTATDRRTTISGEGHPLVCTQRRICVATSHRRPSSSVYGRRSSSAACMKPGDSDQGHTLYTPHPTGTSMPVGLTCIGQLL